MESKWSIFLCTLLLVEVRSDHPRVVQLLSQSLEKIAENVFFLIVDCDDFNLHATIATLEEVQKRVSKERLNAIVEPFSRRVSRPSIFAKTFTQLLDALENHACEGKLSYEGWEWSAKMQSVIRRAKEQAHTQDAIFAFTNSRVEEWKEVLKEIKRPIHIIWTGTTNVPETFLQMAHQNGHILADNNGQNLQMKKILENNSAKYNDTSKYRHSTMMHSLQGNTRTEIHLPEQAFRMFLTVRGMVLKALLVLPSGIVINITPERSQNFNNQPLPSEHQSFAIYYDTPIVKGSENWILVADGNRFNMSMLTLLAQEAKEGEAVLQNKNDKVSSEEKSINQKDTNQDSQMSRNAVVLTNRIDVGEALPLIKGQHPHRIADPLAAGFLTKIVVDVQSNLYAFPGEEVQVIFQVTNTKPLPYPHNFDCFYPQQPCFIQPKSVTLLPQQRIQVAVSVRAEGSEGSSSVLTFISQSVDYAEKKVYIYVGRQKSDTRSPDIDYEYNGNCDDANTGRTCHQKKWSANLWAQDSDSGLLNFWSEPPGLVYTTEFIVGTREKVSARYSASCCNPKSDIHASDLRGNTYKITLNIERIYFSALEIIAMVLGVILLIILIAAIIYGIVRWRRRRKERAFLQ